MSTTRSNARTWSRTLPEWRRICHYYIGDSPLSLCGTTIGRPGENHH